jgi:hypothetical protein
VFRIDGKVEIEIDERIFFASTIDEQGNRYCTKRRFEQLLLRVRLVRLSSFLIAAVATVPPSSFERQQHFLPFISSATMSISYEEALETLQSMFGEAWTREGLDTVLRHKNGHMEDTVDAILRHGDRDPQVLIDQIAAGIDPEQSARDMDEALARQLAQGERVRSVAAAAAGAAPNASGASSTASVAGSSTSSVSSSSSLAPVGMPKGHGTPTTLPDDFLRIPGGFTPPSLVDDEMLARMLQDELFSQELARNPQFAHLARGRGAAGAGEAAGSSASRRTFTARGGPTAANSPVPNIMEKISELGDNTRRRLQLMAAQFNAARANHAQGGGGGSADSPTGGAAATPGAASAAAERRGLLDDMDDLELAARKDL